MKHSIVETIIEYGITCPEKQAIVAGKKVISYLEFANNIIFRSRLLRDRDVKRGDRVILAAEPIPEYLYYYFALHLLGAIVVPVEKKATKAKIEPIISETLASQIILDYKDIPIDDDQPFEELDIKVALDSVADIIYTTGTTGQAKGVMLTHGNMLAGANNVIVGGKMKREDINLLPVPLHHAYGLTTMRAIFYYGSTLVLQDGFSSILAMHKNIHDYHCTSAYLIPAVLPLLLNQTRNNLSALLGSLEKLEFCTAPLSIPMRRLLKEQLPNVRIYNSYGSTEAARSIYMDISRENDKHDSIGRAVDNVSVRISDINNPAVTLAWGKIGRLAIRGGMVMSGYYHSPELTGQVLYNQEFLTSDIGYMDEESYIYLLGREHDVLNIGGEKVSPDEIENIAYESGYVEDCACISSVVPHPVLGDVPILFVVYKSGDTSPETHLKQYLKEHLEKFKLPTQYIACDELPRNYMGKLDRGLLRRMLVDHS